MTLAVRSKSENVLAWEVLNDLIGRIYECALEPTLWDDTLSAIVAALSPLNWETAFILWERSHPVRVRFVAGAGLAPGVREIYASVYAGANPWSRRIAALPVGKVVDTNDIMSREEFRDCSLYRDFLGQWSMDRALAVVLDRQGAERLALIMPGPTDRPLETLSRGLRILAPHIQRAVRISHRIAAAELRADAAGAAADQAPFGILTLAADLSIITANRLTARLVDRDFIDLSGGRLAFRDPLGQRRLEELARETPPASATFMIGGGSGETLAVLAARLAPRKEAVIGGWAGGASLIVTIGARSNTPTLEINRLAAWYGLTPAEGRLAVALSQGISLADHASSRCVSLNAVRFLLKGVYAKTGAQSQAQLVSILRDLPLG